MPRDELRQPLRQRSLRERLWARRPSAFAVAVAAAAVLVVGGGIWVARLPAPLAGEPVVVAAIPAVAELATSATTPAPEAAAESGDVEAVIEENAAIAETGQEESAEAEPAYQREASIIMAPHRALKSAPIAAVTEVSARGPLPKVSDRGKKPFDVYAQTTPTAVLSSNRPKIAIVLGGMGLNAKLTKRAALTLPGDISFAFAPYGENLQQQVNQARAKGHEILLQVPMEPVGYPGTNPGPETLLSDAEEAKNIEALHWHMARFAGYCGIMNYMGARLLVTEAALTPVVRELKRRGLVYLEDATVNLTLSPRITEAEKLPMRRASLVLDADPSPAAIADALQRLEEEAIANGSAIATGAGLEATIETVAEWAKGLHDKGILLVPVSTIYRGRPS